MRIAGPRQATGCARGARLGQPEHQEQHHPQDRQGPILLPRGHKGQLLQSQEAGEHDHIPHRLRTWSYPSLIGILELMCLHSMTTVDGAREDDGEDQDVRDPNGLAAHRAQAPDV